MKKISVLVVDDSFFMRKVIGDFLGRDPDIEVIGEANDGREAIKKIAELNPQVVTLDIEMPAMNGVDALRAIVAEPHHPSVVMVSGYVEKGAEVTLQCLALGAADFVLKPSGSFSLDMEKVQDILVRKVKIAARADTTKVRAVSVRPARQWRYAHTGGVVAIGASTGGPVALEAVLPAFPQNFPYPVVVAQHLPKTFTKSLADRLQQKCQLRVLRVEPNMPVKPGTIYIAAGSTTTTIIKRGNEPVFSVEKNNTDIETPSVNKLMASAAAVYGDKTIGVILTGMGKDGAEGMAKIKKAGGKTIVQDEHTSAVFGMGREVAEAGLADNITPLDLIAETVSESLTI